MLSAWALSEHERRLSALDYGAQSPELPDETPLAPYDLSKQPSDLSCTDSEKIRRVRFAQTHPETNVERHTKRAGSPRYRQRRLSPISCLCMMS